MSDINQAIKIRNFPYPFKSGLAICSDIDECDIDNFIKIHRFVNSKKTGLGLPIADSFFGATNNPNQISYFDFNGEKRSREAEFIRQAIKDGLIDSLHSWGDFNHAPPEPIFLHSIASKMMEECILYNLKIPVWINHGSPYNHQNLFSRLCTEYQGDNPSSPLYTMQFIKKIGIKYYWGSELVAWPLSSRASGRRRIAINHIKNIAKILFMKYRLVKSSQQITLLSHPTVLRDGSSLIAFNRFASHPKESERWMAARTSLRYSLAREVLEQLIQEEGYLLIYVHLAKPVSDKKDIFDKNDENALKLLSDYYNKKTIWVAPTSKILQFKTTIDYIKWKSVDVDGKIFINIIGIEDPINGMYVPPVSELSGICFYSPSVESTEILLAEKKIAVKIFSKDREGSGWIGFEIADVPKTELVE
ncbi:hypothetical protein VU06_00150 [Desulfobulbus sp. F3]|nr:hypothetical protein [Desulfobulbus sp. F3]